MTTSFSEHLAFPIDLHIGFIADGVHVPFVALGELSQMLRTRSGVRRD